MAQPRFPLEVLERASAMLTRLGELESRQSSRPIWRGEGAHGGAKTGTLENRRINCAIKDQDFRASVEARLRALNLDE